MQRIKLSKNFYLDEFTRSQTAARHGIEIKVEPGSVEFANLKRLCETVLQPIRDSLGPVHISSGYRPPKLNRLLGGSRTSAHLDALAADFTVSDHTPYEVCRWMRKKGIVFDQCIHEFGQWVHVGLAMTCDAPRHQLLTAYKKPSRIPGIKPKTVYVPGIQRISEILKD